MYLICEYAVLDQFNPLCSSPFPFTSHPPIIQQLSECIITSSTCTDAGTVILFSFPSSSNFHRIVSLLQTCSTYKCIFDHVCFCVCVYVCIYLPTYDRKHAAFMFLILGYFSQFDPFTFKTCVITPYD
jgi:hypothetical protein